MKLSFPHQYRYFWMFLLLVDLAGERILSWMEAPLVADAIATKEISLGLACLFLFLTIFSREKVEDERLLLVRGRAFASALFLGVIFSSLCVFLPLDKTEPFYNSSGMMIFLQAGYLLDFHVRKNRDR